MGFLHSCIFYTAVFFTKQVCVQLAEQKHNKHEKWLALYLGFLIHVCVIYLFKSRSCRAAGAIQSGLESFLK